MTRWSIMRTLSATAWGILLLASVSYAKDKNDMWGWYDNDDDDNSRSELFAGSGGRGGGRGGSGSSTDFDAASQFLGFDPDMAKRIRLVHGVLASLAFVIFFPVGAITIRVIPSRAAIWIHATMQMLAYAVYIAAFGMGVYLVRLVRFGNFSLLTHHHPVIGIVIFAFLFFQPILGVIHHKMFRKYARRTVWSYGHLWLGRVLITLGIINGGLGLRLANNTRSGEIAYGVVAGVIWLLWMAAAVYGEVKRRRAHRAVRESHAKGSPGTSTVGADPAVAAAPAHAPPYGEAAVGYYGRRPGEKESP